VLGLSPDPVEKLKKWHDKEDFGFDLLSDPDHKILEKYGAWGEKKLYGKTYFGVIRSHWLIGPDGKVLDEQLKVSPVKSIELGVAGLVG
jgi:peroxiredoxin Q/BCP